MTRLVGEPYTSCTTPPTSNVCATRLPTSPAGPARWAPVVYIALSMRPTTTIAILAAALLGSPAWAGKKAANQAEVRRLYEDADRLSDRGAWSGVERAYLQMLTLERKGAELTHDHHLLGAMAAQNRGDPFATWERLRRAQELESRMETLTQLATIEATYSRFEIEIHPSFDGEITLTSLDPLFDPVHRATLEAAEATLQENRYLEGLLPLGRYRLAEQVALESYGGEPQQVVLRANRATVLDPSEIDFELPDPDAMGRTLSVVARADLDARSWSKLASTLQSQLLELEGVDAIEVRPVPPARYFADFQPQALADLGLSGEALADAIRSAHQLPDAQLEVKARQLVVDPDGVKNLEALAQTEVTIDDIQLALNTLAKLREGPQPGAPAAGLELKLTATSDAPAVRSAVAAVLDKADFSSANLVLSEPTQISGR